MGRSCPDNALGNAYRCSSKRGVVAVEVSVRNVPHSLVHLNTGSPAGDTVALMGSAVLLKEVCHLKQSSRVLASPYF